MLWCIFITLSLPPWMGRSISHLNPFIYHGIILLIGWVCAPMLLNMELFEFFLFNLKYFVNINQYNSSELVINEFNLIILIDVNELLLIDHRKNQIFYLFLFSQKINSTLELKLLWLLVLNLPITNINKGFKTLVLLTIGIIFIYIIFTNSYC